MANVSVNTLTVTPIYHHYQGLPCILHINMCCILLADKAVILFTLVLHKHRHKSLGVIFQLAAVLLKRQEFSGMLWFLATDKTTIVIIMGAPLPVRCTFL